MVALLRPDELPPPEDGLPVRRIKEHTHDKLDFWRRYIGFAATATRAKYSEGRVCADLFSGYGVCLDADGQRAWGTSLLALQVPSPFEMYFFNDNNPVATDALYQRALAIGVSGAAVLRLDLRDPDWRRQARAIIGVRTLGGPKVIVCTGDANEAHLALKMIAPPRNRFLLAVIDPESLTYKWEAFEALAYHQRHMDALVLFPDEMDLGRGLPYYLREDGGKKLDDCFGPKAGWRTVATESKTPASALRHLYEQRIENLLGLYIGRPKTIYRSGTKRALYRLVFASRNKGLAVRVWDDIVRLSRHGEEEFYFPPGV